MIEYGALILTRENISAGSALQCHAVHNKFDVDSPGIEPRPPRWGAGDLQLEPWHSRWCVSLPLCVWMLKRVSLCLLVLKSSWKKATMAGGPLIDSPPIQMIGPSGRLASLSTADIFSCQILQASLSSPYISVCAVLLSNWSVCPPLHCTDRNYLTCFAHLAYSRAIKLTAYFITRTIPLESFIIQRHITRNFSHNLLVYQWAFIGAKVLSYLLLYILCSPYKV